jgi:hypothetical protein
MLINNSKIVHLIHMRKIYTTLSIASCLAFSLLAEAAVTPAILPTAAGTYSSWTPSTGATHYTLVDETTCNGTTDYVSTTVLNNKDSFAVSLASIPNGSLITSISLSPCASRNTNSASGMAVFYRANGTDSANGASYALSGTKPVDLSATNFNGLSITKTASTTLEAGVVLLTGTGGARLSRMATVITYTEVPVTPTFVSAVKSTTTPNTIRVSWSGSSSNTGTQIERSVDGVNFTIASTTGAFGSYLDSGLATGTYSYRLAGVNALGLSAYSSTTAGVSLP